MKFLEKDLEEIIYNQLKSKEGCKALLGKGLMCSVADKTFRQLRIGNYGITDIVNYYKPIVITDGEHSEIESNHYVNVIELKKDSVSLSAFIQGVRYCKGIKRFFNKKGYNLHLSLTLIGSKVDMGSDIIYLPDLIDSVDFDVQLYTYSYEIDGLKFEEHRGYKLINEGF
jgi:hypothetical protein